MLTRAECLAFMLNAVLNPPSSPPLLTWIIANEESLANAFERTDFLRLKHRGLPGTYAVLERLGQLGDRNEVDSIDFDEKNCRWCGTKLFWATPKETSREEIAEFGRLIKNKQIENDAWIHPGVYCPNGGITRIFNFESHGFWGKLENARKLRETASIIVDSESEQLNEYKIYLDRYICKTAPNNNAPLVVSTLN